MMQPLEACGGAADVMALPPDRKLGAVLAESLQQIAKGGAPVDVFVSADEETMDQAEKLGVVQGAQRRDVVSNALVVIVPVSAAKAPRALTDLAQPAVARIAIGLPASVPVGRYTKAVLDAASLWAAIEPKMVGATNVR